MIYYSQSGEELIVERFLPNKQKNFVIELGAGDGYHLSNSRYFINKGWKHLLIDADNRGNSEIKQHKITKENINQLLKKYKCPKKIDLLSIDLDGNDYWILEEILKEHKPNLIIAEFNAAFTDSRSIKYEPEFTWNGDDYFGFTFLAGEKLAQKFGYTICLQHADMNLFMLRNDLFKDNLMGNKQYNKSNYFEKSIRNDWEII